ncbi:hypothetical protein [Pseudomonas putida]|uniref:hypothetical protein n=1 Tax=Pseudomonas putida TaxID=303 RepID=UPI0018760101|nr:hypothetical protein [Pseudomonas putida]
MPGPSHLPPVKPDGAVDAHDVSERSVYAMLEVPEGTDSPYPADQGQRAGDPDLEGYPADPEFQLRGGFGWKVAGLRPT